MGQTGDPTMDDHNDESGIYRVEETDDGWQYDKLADDLDGLAEQPTYYVNGEEVKVRGVEFRPEEARSGGGYIQWYAFVQFPEEPGTTRVHPNQLKVEGGSEALNDDLTSRGLLPEWATKNDPAPWTRDDDGGQF